MKWVYPRPIHSEIMTHRALSRNAASSRAIPAKKLRLAVTEQPFVPLEWLLEQPGMTGGPALLGNDALIADAIWLDARDYMVRTSEALSELGVHKSMANRLIEPFMWITVLITATEWDNLWHLRVAKDAEQHFRHIASMAQDVYRSHTPALIRIGDRCPWHLPLIREDDFKQWRAGDITTVDLIKVSIGRCARVSYLTHEGKRDLQADIDLYDRLLKDRHMSPFEHVAEPKPAGTLSGRNPYDTEPWSGNFYGWHQYRKGIPGENYTER